MSGKRRDEAAEMYQQPGVTKIKRPAVRSLAEDGRIDLKRVRHCHANAVYRTSKSGI